MLTIKNRTYHDSLNPLLLCKVKEVCLVQYFDWKTEEAQSKKLKWHFSCQTEMNDNDSMWKKTSNNITKQQQQNRSEKPKVPLRRFLTSP